LKKSGKKWIVFGCVLLVIIVAVLYWYTSRDTGTLYIEETAEIRDVITYYSFSGNIDAKNKQNVIFAGANISLGGINVKPGDYVRTGDILYTLDSIDVENNVAAAAASVELARIGLERAQGAGPSQTLAQARVALTTAENAYKDAQANIERTSALYEAGAVTAQALEQATNAIANTQAQLASAQAALAAAQEGSGQNVASALAQYDQAQANLNNAQNALSNRQIKAKVDGVVADVYIQENSTLNTGERIMDIIDYDSLIVEIRIDEYEITAVSAGKEVDVYINALDKNMRGVITKISNQARKLGDLSYFTAEITLDKSPDLRIGLSTEVKVLNVNQIGVLTVTSNALRFDVENRPFVYQGANNKPERKFVEIGKNDGVIVEITGGLEAGDIVLVPWSAFRRMPPGVTRMGR